MTINNNFNANFPQVDDSFADWQITFQKNFQILASSFSKNHVALNAASNKGNHSFVELLEQGTAQQTNVGEVALYCKKLTDQTDQLYLRYEGNGQEVLMTPYQLYSVNNPSGQTSFFTFLPGGIIVYFGQFTAQQTLSQIQLFPPVAKNIITINIDFVGIIAADKPSAMFPTAENGFYKSIFVNFPTFPGKYNYIVLANI